MRDVAVWSIAIAAIAGLVIRPFRWPEAVWAVAAAVLVVAFGLLSLELATRAIAKGTDVYLFLVGMMLLSETARRVGLFDWVAAVAVEHARGSPRRLFALVYVVGIVVTTFLSNDATAVVLTPAVYAVARRARVEPLPYLFACAFVANAASFVLPISNPANIVLYGDHVPPLGDWLVRFGVPSVLAIVATYCALWFAERRGLAGVCDEHVQTPTLSAGAWAALVGIGVTALVLMTVSALDRPLGWPTALCGVATTLVAFAVARRSPWLAVKGVSWSVLPLVAGLFVLVDALASTGLIGELARTLTAASTRSTGGAPWGAGLAIAFVSNVANNLPVGLVASSTIQVAQPPQVVIDAMLIGVDLGPNLSITGSLATILWLQAIRREGEDVTFGRFLRVGAVVMTPALVLALAARVWLA